MHGELHAPYMSDKTQQNDACLLKLQIGPVQEFIAQARSTRDLWSGSYLLSWLIAAGLHTREASGAKIIYPASTAKAMVTPASRIAQRVLPESVDRPSVSPGLAGSEPRLIRSGCGGADFVAFCTFCSVLGFVLMRAGTLKIVGIEFSTRPIRMSRPAFSRKSVRQAEVTKWQTCLVKSDLRPQIINH